MEADSGLARGEPQVPIVEVQPARAEDARREVQLRSPVLDDGATEKPLRPRVHLARDLLGGGHEHIGACERQLQVALVVERHGVDLPERVLAVEHPAVGAREERVGDAADALGRPGARPRRGPGPLDPLPLEIVRDRATVEAAGPGIAHRDGRSTDRRVRRQEGDPLVLTLATRAALDARPHESATSGIERRQCGYGLQRAGREHVSIGVEHAFAQAQRPDSVHRVTFSQSCVALTTPPHGGAGASAHQGNEHVCRK